MGSAIRLVVVGQGGERAWTEVSAEFAATDLALSRFRDDAELVALDRAAGTGIPMAVSRRLERAIHAAERARRLTDGRFDPRVLADLERIGEQGATMGLEPDRITRPRASSRILRHAGRGCLSLDHPVDLGGIGKGLALRWAAARVERTGVRDFLLDAGGDVVARGRPRNDPWWRIGIEDPHDAVGSCLAVAGVTDGAIATSSILRRRWDHDGKAVHHLIDPRTGEPGWTGLHAVTVAGPDPAWAEVWSKTLFLAGSRDVAVEARSRGLAAWWIDDAGTLGMSPAARAQTLWVRGEA
jgi:thiamine biosynthesis lipoprotein